MFTLKKIISAFIMPVPFSILLGLIGLYFLYKNSYTKAKVILTLSFILLFISSYNPVANKAIHTLEAQYEQPKIINTDIEYALLLGGDFERRAYGILEIYHQHPNITIVTSGYAGNESIAEAIINKQRLIKMGIPESKIIIQDKPKDTISEAISMKKIVDKKPFYLVTSASHMPRAMGLFQKQGLNPIAYPTGHLEKETNYIKFPTTGDADKLNKAFHEYIGITWSSLKGDI